MSVGRALRLALYYGFARFLPRSDTRYTRWGSSARRLLCRGLFRSAGEGINVERGAWFGDGAQIEIGDRSGIGVDCALYGPVQIGADVMMGPEVLVFTANHRFDRLDLPMLDQGYDAPRTVVVGDDAWIGQRAILLPGVRIGRGAIVGAAAVVTRDVPDFAIVGGNPARVIGSRKPEMA